MQDATDSLREKEAKLKETEEEHGNDLENSLIQLEQEQQRYCAQTEFEFYFHKRGSSKLQDIMFVKFKVLCWGVDF